MTIENAPAAGDTAVVYPGFQYTPDAPSDGETAALSGGGTEMTAYDGGRDDQVVTSVGTEAAAEPRIAVPEMVVETVGDQVEAGDAAGYGAYDEHADPDGNVATPKLDRVAELLAQERQYSAGFGSSPLKHVGLTFGAGLVSGLVIMGLASSGGSGGPNAFESNTQKVAAAAEYPGGDPASATAAAVQALNVETIPPAANPGDAADINHLIQTAVAQGAADMNGGNENGIPVREWAEETFAADELSGVAVPESGREAMAAAELAGGSDNADFMKAADAAYGAALDAADHHHVTIRVPLSDK